MGQAGIMALVAWAAISTTGGIWLLILWRRHARVVDEVARGIAALGEGRPARAIPAVPAGMARLARAYDEVAPRLEARIARLEGDRQLLRAVLGGMTEGVIAVDSRRRILFANDAAQRFFALGGDSVGRLVAELIRSPHVQVAIESTLARSESYQDEISVASPDSWPKGPTLLLLVHGRVLPGTPAPGAVLVFHDVTETRRLERVRQDFVANASHELKTPLASIKAYAETLLDWALHDEAVNVKFLHRIDEQADRLNQLILDLLSLARLESGQDFFQHGPLVLAPVVRQAVETHRARAESKGLEYGLTLDLPAELAVVHADEEAIRQILDNLVDNAIKYTPEGGRVRVTLLDRGADGVVLEVMDTGIGIPRDDLPRVFERFYRVDKARSRQLGGTGLGLSIVKHLTQALEGTIAVESRVGYGSTFTVRFPTHRPIREEIQVASPIPSSESDSSS